jgi:hypothetical protein
MPLVHVSLPYFGVFSSFFSGGLLYIGRDAVRTLWVLVFVFFFVFLGPPFAHFEPGLSSSPGVMAAQFIREIPCWQHG